MGYRSLKRYLGETNLQRKCFWLFGICLLALIAIAFGSVDYIGARLVMKNVHRNGREWVRTFLFDKHWERWETDPAQKATQQKLSQMLLGEKHEALVLSPDRGLVTTMDENHFNQQRDVANHLSPRLVLAVDEKEEQVLLELKNDFYRQLADIRSHAGQGTDESEETAFPTQAPTSDVEPEHIAMLDPVFATREAPSEGNYYFYQPVYWQKSCISCHEGMYGKYAVAASDTALSQPAELPFLVVRIALPYREARAAINYTHAVLLSIGMLTVVTSMIALYYIVKYIIVKPLDHLCDVSDAISRGDLDQRADIHTNDEFEELAASFNKMLRHLTDAQVDLQRVNSDLDAKVDQLAQLNMRLHEMNRLKGEFLANMSHELRTPLNSIIGFSEVLAGIDSLNERQKRYANNIQKSGRILLDMINDILDLAKLEAGKMELRLSEFRIDAIIHAQCDMVRSLTEDKNIDLAIDVEGDLPALFQDQSKVQQILNNLLSNAIKFTPEGGRITVGAVGHPRGLVEMYVADTGVGIAEADREIIFEKFRQGTVLGRDNLTREHSGTGLGLSIVKELCKLLGGEVTVESELGKGSTFRVLIPWMKAEPPQATSKMNSKLDDLTKPRRADFQRMHEGADVATVGSAADSSVDR